jgi:GDP-D-mannose 3', 5'-epimerase
MTVSKAQSFLMNSDYVDPLNIGSDEMVSINQLVDIVEDIAGVKLKRSFNLDAPKGVRGRNSENTWRQAGLNLAPLISLRSGMEKT